MGRKKTIKSQLDELNRETLEGLAGELPVTPVAATNFTGVKDVLGGSPAWQAAYAAERARLDAAVANSPLFAGQGNGGEVRGLYPDKYAGQVGGNITRQVMRQGLNPNVAQSPAGSVPPEAEVPVVEQAQTPAVTAGVGSKAAEKIYKQGVVPDQYAGKVGGDLTREVMQQGLYPDMPKTAVQQEAEQARQAKGNWNDFLDPYIARQKELETERDQLLRLDEEMQRREDARKRIVALGDAFASFANLIGTAHGAENQRQTYASPLVSESVEGARKLRVGRMEQIRRNIDEQADMIRQLQLKNDPNYLPNKMEQERINVQYGNQRLQYDKLAQTKTHQANQDALGVAKLDRLIGNDQWNRDFKVRQQEHKESVDDAKIRQANARIGLANRKYADQLAGRNTGGGSGTNTAKGGWSKGAPFSAFKSEVAARNGYGSWEEFANSVSDRDMLDFVDNVNEAATSTGKQEAILNSYAEQYAPDFYGKYHFDTPKNEKERKTLYDLPSGKKSTLQGF